MTVRRTARLAVAAAVATAAGVAPAAPALAHGTPVSPASRTSVCAQGGPAVPPVCAAARAANGGPFGAFDNLRRAGVDGRDREMVPDGHLCGGGLPEYRGLDLAGTDWPATELTAGTTVTVRYRTTIAHRGEFRFYLTRPVHDPARPLRWADLDADPLAVSTDPPVRDGAYRIRVPLPDDRTGRHVLYTVWRNSDTPDTYYSCSDLLLRSPAGTLADEEPADAGSADAGTGVGADAAGAAPAATHESWLRPAEPIAAERIAPGRQLITAALVVLIGVSAALGVRRLRAAHARGGRRRR